GATYWGAMPFTDYPNAYVGMITIALGLLGLLTWNRARVFAVSLAVVALAIAFGKHSPLYGVLYDHLPLFNKFRVPVMILVLFQLATALGLAWGWSAVLEQSVAKKPDARLPRLLLGIAGALIVALVLGGMGQEAWRAGYVKAVQAGRPEKAPQVAEVAFRGFIGDLVRVSLLGLVAVALAWLVMRRRVPAAIASLLVLVLLIFELWPVSGQVMAPVIGPRVPQLMDQGRTDVVEFLEKAGPPGTFRVLPLSEFQNNRFAGFAVASIGGYHAAKPRRFQDLVDRHVFENPYWLRLLNVRYILSPQPLEIPRFRAVFQGAEDPRFPDRFVFVNPDALPRATLLHAYRVAPSDTAILDSISAGLYDPARV